MGEIKERENMINQKSVLKLISKLGDMSFKRRFLKLIDYLNQENHNSKMRILDVGCGEGFYLMSLCALTDHEIVGIEYDEELVSKTLHWIRTSEVKNLPQVIKGDATNLNFEDNSFDFVICSEVLEHIDDDIKAANEIYRILKPGGRAFVTVPNLNYPLIWDPLNWFRKNLNLGHFSSTNTWFGGVWSYDHKRLYLPEQIKQVLHNAGFSVKDICVLTHYGVPFNVLLLQILKKLFTAPIVPSFIKDSAEKFTARD